MGTPTIATVVFPARDFEASVNAWTSVFGAGPAFSSSGQQTAPGEADFAVFKGRRSSRGASAAEILAGRRLRKR